MTLLVQWNTSENRQSANSDGFLDKPDKEANHGNNHTLLPVGRC